MNFKRLKLEALDNGKDNLNFKKVEMSMYKVQGLVLINLKNRDIGR